jgi:hypothetical protein
MRGDELSRQWRAVRAIEASPKGFTATEIAQREETGIRTICQDLEVLHAAGLHLRTERAERDNRWAFVDIFNFRVLLPFTLTEVMSPYCYKNFLLKALDDPLTQYPMGRRSVDLMRKFRAIWPGTLMIFQEPERAIFNPTTGIGPLKEYQHHGGICN